VLSRLAVSLYVMGGRLERTEHLARLLRVHFELSLDRLRPRDDRFWSRFLELAGWPPGGPAGRGQAIELALSGATGPSVRRAVAEARSAAQAVRPTLSTEVFEQVNSLHWRLFDGGSETALHGYLRDAELGVQLVTGLVEETMPYDEARDFLRLGKFVERGGATARLVALKAAELEAVGDDAIEWAATLRCCNSVEAYRRVSARVGPRGVVEFLLGRRANPRSAAFSVDEALTAVRRIDGDARHSSAQDLLVELAGVVDRADPDSVIAAPADFGGECARLRAAVEDALRSDFFLPNRPAAPMLGETFTPQSQQQQQSP
jgi:uncharacterized alpha-E superfamily protein